MARPKKVKKPGDQIPLKLKENEPEHIVAWFNAQDSFAASLRYLIEKDIMENGIRDVKEEILNSFLHYKPHFQQAPGVVSGNRSIIEEETAKESTRKVVGSMPPHKNDVINNDTKIEELTKFSQKNSDENHQMSKQGVNDTHQSDSPKPPKITSNENKVDDDLDIDELNIFG
ncbi:hypothetical protein IIE26_26875 (plasmid) [Cytobacillus oceanisediminis]|uniref:hypothetical protein n=1 Tax=Cytobacillus oceanisediminis TaxID=665099 RepID=UPI0018640291|nr:hypothetical protein [Cytobacillus oceanisediminis]QOK29993.1 hypothetical protein IIE26_26875 [Cytobacillus oceanisediminis]